MEDLLRKMTAESDEEEKQRKVNKAPIKRMVTYAPGAQTPKVISNKQPFLSPLRPALVR